MVTVRVPLPSSMLLINLLGLCGLLGLAVAVGGLTHNWWWSLLALGAEAVFLSVVGAQNARSEPAEVIEPHELATVRSRPA
jgi:hypothetical protein